MTEEISTDTVNQHIFFELLKQMHIAMGLSFIVKFIAGLKISCVDSVQTVMVTIQSNYC